MKLAFRLLRIGVATAAALSVWYFYWKLRATPAHEIVRSPGGVTTIFHAGLGFIALYGFLVVILLVPPLLIAAALLEDRGARSRSGPNDAAFAQASSLTRWVYGSFGAAALCLAAGLAGYGYEASETEITLSQKLLTYRSGNDRTTISLPDVTGMVLTYGPRSQRMLISAQHNTTKIELDTIPVPDQILLAKDLSSYAGLTQLGHNREAGVIVWRRLGRANESQPN